MERRWYQQTWAIIALLWLFFPVGLYLMWRHASWSGRWKWAISGILAVLVVVVAISGAVGGGDDGDDSRTVVGDTATEPPPTEQATQKPTEPPSEIATEAPTAEPTAPHTPEPTAPPTQGLPELTAAECTYLGTVTGQSEDLGDALGQIGELAGNPLLFSDDWILNMSLQLAIIRVTYDTASALDPPASLQQVHEAYLEGLSNYNDATFLIVEGIDSLDANPLLEGIDLMLEGTEDISRTTALIEEFGVTRSGSCS